MNERKYLPRAQEVPLVKETGTTFPDVPLTTALNILVI